MNNEEFELFISKFGKDILRFCRMKAGPYGDELYQETLLKLLEKKNKIDLSRNAKSYALSVCMFIWNNKKRKYLNRQKIAPQDSLENLEEAGVTLKDRNESNLPEEAMLKKTQRLAVRDAVAALPEKYSTPLYLYYSAGMRLNEIAEILKLPVGTVKSRMRKAKESLKKELEDKDYDGREAGSNAERRLVGRDWRAGYYVK